MTKPSPATARVQEFRKRQKEKGLSEVRNIWAKPEDHERIKQFAASLNKPA